MHGGDIFVMTRRQFSNLWVGSIVHSSNFAYRVIAIDPVRGRLTLAKMPESVYPGELIRDVGYRKVDYVAAQKPPIGQYYFDEEDLI